MIALLRKRKKKVTGASFTSVTNHPHVVHPVNRESYGLNRKLNSAQKRWLRHSFSGEAQV